MGSRLPSAWPAAIRAPCASCIQRSGGGPCNPGGHDSVLQQGRRGAPGGLSHFRRDGSGRLRGDPTRRVPCSVPTYETKGGIRVHREIAVQPYSPADTRAGRAARRPARRAVLVELRVSRPLHALGHGVCRSAAGADRARARLHDRGAERARPVLLAADRRASGRPRRRCGSSTAAPTGSRARSARATSAFPRSSAAGSRRSSRCCARSDELFASPRGRASRALRRVRLRSRLPVRADAAAAAAARRPARPRAVSARRDPDRRSHAAAIGDPPLRVRGRRPLDRRPAARDRAGAVSLRAVPCRCRRKAITARANTPRWSSAPRRPSCAAICSRSSAASCSPTRCPDPPSVVFQRLRRANPAPYGALINLGEGEFLVSASPEMYVRVEGRRIETCPICGTIARGRDALEDAERIRELLNSTKDESELTMCTDVDRNDKSRVCVPGSVKVIGRRQIEIYSRLIHTVDHVEGELRAGIRRARRVSEPCLGGDRDRRAETAGRSA